MTLYNEELEKIVIGSVLSRGSLTADDQKLSTLDFFHSVHILLWSKILEMDEDGEPLNPIELHRRCLEQQATFPYRISDITQLAVGIPATARPQDISTIRDLAMARRLQKVFLGLSEKIEESPDVNAILNEAEDAITTLRKNANIVNGSSKQLYQVMEDEVFPRLDKFVSGDTVKLGFGFQEIDEATNGGVGIGELVILGAKPKSGKSALTLQIASTQAMAGQTALIVSREMLNFENGFRFLAQNSKYTNNIFRPNLMPEVAEKLKERGREHYGLPLFFDDRSKKVSEIRREAKMLKDVMGLHSVFVDYAQLVRPEAKKQSRADDLEAIYYDLKELAQDLEVAVFVNAQFNRQGIKSDRPTMADFDGSSAAEKAGNLILLWNIEQDYSEMCRGKKGKLWIEAGRNVGTDEFDIVFHGAHSRFSFGDYGYESLPV